MFPTDVVSSRKNSGRNLLEAAAVAAGAPPPSESHDSTDYIAYLLAQLFKGVPDSMVAPIAEAISGNQVVLDAFVALVAETVILTQAEAEALFLPLLGKAADSDHADAADEADAASAALLADTGGQLTNIVDAILAVPALVDALDAALGGGLPAWITTVDTAGIEEATFGGHVTIFPTDQTDAVQEGLLVIRGTDDLVNQSNLGAHAAALIKQADWQTPAGPYNLGADYAWMLSVLGLDILTPVEEGAARINIRARGVTTHCQLTNSSLNLAAIDGVFDTAIGAVEAIFGGTVRMAALPTAEPATVGELWNDAGVVKVSNGP